MKVYQNNLQNNQNLKNNPGESIGLKFILTQAEIKNWTNVDPTLDTNFRLSSDIRNENDVLR